MPVPTIELRRARFANRKLGTRLLLHLEALARDLGIDAVNLKASLNAVPFYEAAGYTAMSSGWNLTTNGLRMACVSMEKRLAARLTQPA